MCVQSMILYCSNVTGRLEKDDDSSSEAGSRRTIWCLVRGCVLRCVVCALEVGFYRNSCGQAELIVKDEVRRAFFNDPGVAPGLLRMHFHDCFVRGCDASVLLDSTSSNIAEKESPPNNHSLRGFEVIYRAKARLEASCKRVVSCSDILAFAAMDSIEITGGLGYDVPAGRRDGRVSLASHTFRNLPSPRFSVEQLTDMFRAHTIGRSHCTFLSDRLYNFNRTSGEDPSLDPKYAAELRKQCPQGNSHTDAVVPMNPSSPAIADVSYYIDVLANRGLLVSDQTLLTNPETARQVIQNAKNPWLWNTRFANAMVKMGGLDVLTGTAGEIRTDCGLINA